MKLSIIVPMYNVENYIANCIQSLLRQDISAEDYEIIIIDDGSSDNSKFIVEKYKKNNDNIKLISVKNGGQSRARNIGITSAKGDYLFFVDSDDYISDNCLKNLINLSSKNQLDILFFDMKRVNNESYNKSSYNGYTDLKISNGIQYFSYNNVNNGPCHFIISRKFIIDNEMRFIEDRYCEDGMFMISIILKAQRVAYSGADIYRYVEREQSTTTKKTKDHSKKMIEDFMYAINFMNDIYNRCLIEKYPTDFLEKLKSRRNSYIYFMQIRMIKANVGYRYANNIINRLEKIQCYRYSRMIKSEYNDLKTTLIWRILNTKSIFCILCI